MKHFRLSLISFTVLCASPFSFAEDASVEVLETLSFKSSTSKDSYAAKPSDAGTKFTIDPMRSPKNVQVVTSKVLKDTNAQRVSDTLAMVSGVSALNPMGGFWDNYSVRGFNTDQTIGAVSLRNGIVSNLGLSASRDLVNVAQVEFLKGPEAAMYGAGDPGGTLNVVTKKPEFTAKNELSLRAGSHDQYRASLDTTNALTDTVAYRLGIAYENNHSFRQDVKNDRLFIAPQLTWQPNDATQIDYDSEYSRIHSRFDRGVAAVNQQLGVIPRDRFLGEKADGLMTMNDMLQQLRLTHRWNDTWTSKAAFNYKNNTWHGYSSEAFQLLNARGDLNRERRYRDYETTSYLVNHDLLGEFATGELQHKVVIGTTFSHLNIDNALNRYRVRGATSQDQINIYQPIYGVALPQQLRPVFHIDETQLNAGLTLSDFIEIDNNWSVLLGGRVDYYQQDYKDPVSQTSGKQNFTHFSPRAAVNYVFNDHWSAYASVGQSFHLNSGLSRQNQAFDPEKAWTYELGAKSKWLDGAVTSNLTLFHVNKENVLTTDLSDSAYMVATGEMQSRGVEFDLTAEPIDGLNVKFAYTYTDAEVKKGDNAGARLLNSPKHMANLLVRYDLWQSGEQKIGLGGNVQYVAARAGNELDNGFDLPSYTVFNMNAYYDINRDLSLQLTLNNAFDKTYYMSSLKDLWVTPGNSREVFLTANYRF